MRAGDFLPGSKRFYERLRQDVRAMVKETKFFRKQAAKAERMARSVSDAEVSQRFLNMALAYRSQADVLKGKKKAKKKSGKKRR
jgi:hypothetical protein